MAEKIPFRERLAQGPILADGAMGTLLHTRGVALDACFDELNLTDPALVFDIHRTYIEAGAEIIETNTFGANHYKLREHGLGDRVAEINREAVRLARQAVDTSFRPNIYVGASIGPLGVHLAPFGLVSREQAFEAFREQANALCEAGVDVFIIETFSDLDEIREAARAVRDVCPDAPMIVQVTFTRDDRTLLGDSPRQVASALTELDVDVIGVNCSNGPAQITRIVRIMQEEAPDRRFSAVPNAGWPENVGGRVMYAAQPDYFAEFAVALRDLNITVMGGCCGTTPEHIAAMRAAMDDPALTSQIMHGPHMPDVSEEASEAGIPSELAQKIERGEFIIAVEMSPPRGIAAEKVVRAAQLFADVGVDVIDVLDSPMARMRMSPWAVCHLIQTEANLETVLHFPTRGRNLLRIQGDLLAAHAIDVRNLFVVMGDPTHIGDYPNAADNYDIVPSGLVKLIKQRLNNGEDWAGNSIGQPTNFLVSCALSLNAPDLDREIRVVRKKQEGGADYLISQPIFELSALDRFLERHQELHGPFTMPILAGVMPLNNIRHASFLQNEVPGITIPQHIMQRIEDAGDDAPHEGVRIAREIAAQLRERVQGLYLMPQFRRYDLIAEVIEDETIRP